LDESGFCALGEPRYTYYQKGEQKPLQPTSRRGRKLSIVGLFPNDISFIYGWVIRGVDIKVYIQMMESEALLSRSAQTARSHSTGQ
jgi:putative transposase